MRTPRKTVLPLGNAYECTASWSRSRPFRSPELPMTVRPSPQCRCGPRSGPGAGGSDLGGDGAGGVGVGARLRGEDGAAVVAQLVDGVADVAQGPVVAGLRRRLEVRPRIPAAGELLDGGD